MSDSAYSWLTSAEDILKKCVWDADLKAALTALYVKCPYLNFWPVNSLINTFAEALGDKIFEFFRVNIDTSAIKEVNAIHYADFKKADVTLAIIKASKGVDSSEFKAASEATHEAFAKWWSVGACLFVCFFVGCSTLNYPNTTACTSNGGLDAGMLCTDSLGAESKMTMSESIDWLNPTADRAGAVCLSASDADALKTFAEESCRMLGNRCTKPTKIALNRASKQLRWLKSEARRTLLTR